MPNFLSSLNIELRYLPSISENHYQNLVYSSLYKSGIVSAPVLHDHISKLLSDLKPSKYSLVVHQHWLNNIYNASITDAPGYKSIDTYFRQIKLFRFQGGKVIWTVHNLYDHDIDNPRTRLLNQYCICQMARVADLILIHSQDTQPALEEICGFEVSDRVQLLPHPLYDSMLSIQPLSPAELGGFTDFDGLTYLCFGLLRPYKGGLQLLLHYKEQLQSGRLENTRLIFAGIIQDKSLLREHANLPDSIRNKILLINRRVSDAELAWLCIHCDIAVLPYRKILTSGSYYQATTFALPTIVPYSGMFRSMVTDGEDALVYREDSELGAMLQRALSMGKPSLRRMGEKALSRQQPISASAHVSELFVQLLRNLVETSPSSTPFGNPNNSLHLPAALLADEATVLPSLELALNLSALNLFEKLCWWCWAHQLLKELGRPTVLILIETDFDGCLINEINVSAYTSNYSIRWLDSLHETSPEAIDRVFVSSSMTLSDKLLRRFDRIDVYPQALPSTWATDVYWRISSGPDWRSTFKTLLASVSGERWQDEIDKWIYSVHPADFQATALTSIFNGDTFLAGFLDNAAHWDSYPACEHLLVRAASPGNELAALMRHTQQHPNAVYIYLEHDPGLYAVWNLGIRIASGKFLTNANLDDRRAPEQLSNLVCYLDAHPDISAVSAQIRLSIQPNLAWEESTHCDILFGNEQTCTYGAAKLFSHDERGVCSYNLPHCMPVWRRSLHCRAGYFHENRFGASADWAFWINAGLLGARYAYIATPMGLYLRHEESYWRRSSPMDNDLRISAEYADRALRGFHQSRIDFTLRQRIDETLAAYSEADSLGMLSGLLDCTLLLRHLDLVASDNSASRNLIDLMASRWLGMPNFVLFIEQHNEALRDLSDPLNNVLAFVVELLHENSLTLASPISTMQHHLECALLDHYLITRSIKPLLGLALLRRRQKASDAEEYLLSLIMKLAPQSFIAEKEFVYRQLISL